MNPMGEFVEEQKFPEPVLENKFSICRLQTSFTRHITIIQSTTCSEMFCVQAADRLQTQPRQSRACFLFFKGGLVRTLTEYWVEIDLATPSKGVQS